MVQYFLENDHFIYDEINLQYYKKSNVGEQFMDDVNFEKTIKDTQILMCSSYLSVGVDILDRYKFSIYFEDLILPQEIEQYANRLRSNDLYINMYVSKKDSDGNPKPINKFKEMNLTALKADIVSAPLIAESPVNLECKVKQVVELGTHSIFMAEIVNVTVDDKVVATIVEGGTYILGDAKYGYYSKIYGQSRRKIS